MKKPASHRAFTRLELLVSLVVVGLLSWAVYAWSKKNEASSIGRRAKMLAYNARGIHNMLSAWAQDNNGTFPTAQQYSNEAFRELFKAKLFDDENAFHIPRDPWLRKTDTPGGRGPDNEIGSDPDFALALQAGECSYAYVSGLTPDSDPQLPLLANAFSESVGLYTDDVAHRGGVFKGLVCAWVRVGGSAAVSELSEDFRLLQSKNGKLVDVFSAEWGTNPDQIKNPQGE